MTAHLLDPYPHVTLKGTVARVASSEQLSMMNVELIHHFLTSTSFTLWHRKTGPKIWGEVIFEAALQHPPLLSGLLATAAAHKATLLHEPGAVDRYTAFALEKRSDAFNGLMSLLSNPTPETAIETFSLTSLLATWAFASRNLPMALDLLGPSSNSVDRTIGTIQGRRPPLEQFLTLVSKASGTTAVVGKLRPWLKNTAIEEKITLPQFEPEPDVPRHVERALLDLQSRLQGDPSLLTMLDSSHVLIPLRALLHVLTCPDHFNILIVWALRLPSSFIRALSSRNPGALTILAYWVACLDSFDYWWTNGWGFDLVQEIVNSVSDSWMPLLEWPMAVVGCDTTMIAPA